MTGPAVPTSPGEQYAELVQQAGALLRPSPGYRALTRAELDRALQSQVGMNYRQLLDRAIANPVRASAPSPLLPDALRALYTGANAASGGLLEHGLSAAGAAVLPSDTATLGESYNAVRGELRGQREAFAGEHPNLVLPTELAGVAATGGLGASQLLAGGSRFTKLAAPAVLGPVAGAAVGAADAPTLDDVLDYARRGAEGGALATGGLYGIGGAAKLVGAGGGRLLGLINPERAGRIEAMRRVREITREAQVTPALAAGRVAGLEAQAPGQVAGGDVHPIYRSELRAVKNAGAGPIEDAVNAFYARVAGTGERLASGLRTVAALPARTLGQSVKADKDALSAFGRSVYGPVEAAAGDLPLTPELLSFLKSPDVAPLWGRVRPREMQATLRRLEGLVRAGVPLETATATLRAKGEMLPRLQDFQTLRRRFADEIDNLNANRRKSEARDLVNRARTFDEMLEPLAPGLADANTAFRQYANSRRARLAGAEQSRLAPNARHAHLQEAVAAAGPYGADALNLYRQGALQKALEDMLTMAERSPSADIGRRFARLSEELFPNKAAATKWLAQTQAEGTFHDMLRALTQNSTTAEQLTRAGVFSPRRLLANLTAPDPQVAQSRAEELLRLLGTMEPLALKDFLALVAGTNLAPRAAGLSGAATALGMMQGLGAQREPQRSFLDAIGRPADRTGATAPVRP